MSDIYNATYAAVRQSLQGTDIGAAVESVMCSENIGFHASMAAEAVKVAASQYERPSVMMRPKVSIDGKHWCALYGANLQDGVAGFGDSPYLAMLDFDANWYKKIGAQQ